MAKKLDKYRTKQTDLTETIAFKVSVDDKKAFQKFCKDNGLKSGLILRDLLSGFMKENT